VHPQYSLLVLLSISPCLLWPTLAMNSVRDDMEPHESQEKADDVSSDEISRSDTHEMIEDNPNVRRLQRRLGNRQVQLIAIGGSIGTATFISIANGLVKGGPGSLLIAYTLYTCILGLVNNSMAEMASYMPVTGGFIRMASNWVDESLGFWVGWNFFLYEAFLIPFEISALNLVLTFWSDDIPVAAVVAVCIVLYL